REVPIAGKKSGTQVGESSQCVALVKTCTGAPDTSRWRRGRQVVTSNLPYGTAIAKFEADGTYSQTGNGHTGILIGLRSDGSFDIYDQNWGQPSIVRRHTINGTGGGVYDPKAYYEVTAP